MRMFLTLQLHFNRTVGALTPRLLRFMDSDHSDRGQKREDFKKKKGFLNQGFWFIFFTQPFFLKSFCLRKKFVFFSKRKL